MGFLLRLWHGILDFLFGNPDLEKRLRNLTYEELSEKSRQVMLETSVTALFPYADPLIRDMIWALKYRKNKHVAELFGKALMEYTQDMHMDDVVLVPLPLSRSRKQWRGYNQVELVLQTLETSKGVVIENDSLLRTRDTRPQTTLPREERLTNLKHAFKAAEPSKIAGKAVVLVDDVSTTGTTLREARKALMDGGARTVFCVALAH